MYISPHTPSPTTLSFTLSTSPLLRSTSHSLLLLLSSLLRTTLLLLLLLLTTSHYLPTHSWPPWLLLLKSQLLLHLSQLLRSIATHGGGLKGLGAVVVAEERLWEVLFVFGVVVVVGYGWSCEGTEEGLLLVRHLGVQTSSAVISPLPIRFWPVSVSFRRPNVRERDEKDSASSGERDGKDRDGRDGGRGRRRLPPRWLRGFAHDVRTRFIPTAEVQDIFIHEGFRGFEVRFYLSVVVRGEEDVVVVFPEILPRRRILEGVWRGARTCLFERENESWREGVGGVVKEVEGH